MKRRSNSYKENMRKGLDKDLMNPYNEHCSVWEVLY